MTPHERWRLANPELNRRLQREYASRKRAELWVEFFDQYGSACTCCGETNRKFLTLEHVGGLNGRKRVPVDQELKSLKKEGWPDFVTVFCFNCNLGSHRNGGTCPHQIVEDGEL